jgi:hypothetical protein
MILGDSHIRNAWITGIFVGFMTLVPTVLCLWGKMRGYESWMILDAFLIFALAYGIYKKSRVCAVLMLFHFTTCKIATFLFGGGGMVGSISAILFTAAFFMGVKATFTYHRNHVIATGWESTKTEEPGAASGEPSVVPARAHPLIGAAFGVVMTLLVFGFVGARFVRGAHAATAGDDTAMSSHDAGLAEIASALQSGPHSEVASDAEGDVGSDATSTVVGASPADSGADAVRTPKAWLERASISGVRATKLMVNGKLWEINVAIPPFGLKYKGKRETDLVFEDDRGVRYLKPFGRIGSANTLEIRPVGSK